jgi:ABC-type antimicrobial peptide transport system permease subunit
MALGATKRNILRMVLTQGLRLALAGVVAGAAMALVLTRFVSGFSSLLFGVRSDDPLTLIAVSLLLITAALAASYVPACRAASRTPTAAFRDE